MTFLLGSKVFFLTCVGLETTDLIAIRTNTVYNYLIFPSMHKWQIFNSNSRFMLFILNQSTSFCTETPNHRAKRKRAKNYNKFTYEIFRSF